MDFNSTINTVLVTGVNTRPIVQSAKRLDLRVIAVDCFQDLDLVNSADKVFITDKNNKRNKSQSKLYNLTLKVLDKYNVDAILLSSGLENIPKKINKLEKKSKIIGNEYKKIRLCNKEENIYRIAEKLDIKYPDTEKAKNRREAISYGEKIGYPIVLKKPEHGGGIGVKIARNKKEVIEKFNKISKSETEIYIQDYVDGIDASASVISNGEYSTCLSVNRQIIGDEKLGSPRFFGFCGNVVPLDISQEIIDKISDYSKSICDKIGLVGSNGVDFVISNGEPYLMEINPRFQSTIDLLEHILQTNLVEDHIKACEGQIKNYRDAEGWGIKSILYAKNDIITPNLSRFSEIVDIPFKGSFVKKGEPICSIKKFGEERNRLVESTYHSVEKIRKFCQKKSNPSVKTTKMNEIL